MITEYKRISHRLVATLDLASFVDIKQLIALQDLSASLSKNVLDLTCKHLLRNQHTDVTGYCRIFCNSGKLAVKICKFKNALDIDHCDICALPNSIIICNQRMNLSKVTYNGSLVYHIGLSSRMKKWFSACRIILHFLLHTDFFEELLTNALHVKEITGSVHSKCKHGSFIWKLGKWKCLRKIYISKLIKTNVFVSSVIVSCQRRKHSIQCTGTHNAVVLTKRIADGDHLTKYIIFWNSQFVKYLRALK